MPNLDFLDDFINFWTSMDVGRFVGLLWFFFIFDFTRYVLVDLIILFIDSGRRRFLRKDFQYARRLLMAEKPLVSVIAPGRNEGKHIRKLAHTIRNQSYSNIEIVIVDDGSDDNTAEICRQAMHEGLIDRFFRSDVRGGKASAANLALQMSTGKYIIHLDADSHLNHEAIERMILHFYLDDEVGAVGGDVRVANPHDSLATSVQSIEYAKSISVSRRVMSFLGLLRIISGACGAFRRDVLERIGGWDIGPGLDGDITLKVRKLGMRVLFEPDAVCYTNVPQKFRVLTKQRYRWDKSLIRFRLRKHFDLLIPNHNFRWSNFFTVLDNILFNLIMNIHWVIYLTQISVLHAHLLIYIIPMNYMLYMVSNFIQYTVYLGLTLDEKKSFNRLELLLYLPIMPLYSGIYMRLVRSFAYIMEFFFKRSYLDPWNPWKVSKIARVNKI